MGPVGPCGRCTDPDRLLLRAADRAVLARLQPHRRPQLLLSQQLGRRATPARRGMRGGPWRVHVRRLGADLGDAHHVSDRARDRRADRRRHSFVRNGALSPARACSGGNARRPARGCPVGRLRAVGRVRPDPALAWLPAVAGKYVLVRALRRRPGGGTELLHRGVDPRDHDPSDRLGDRPRGHLHGPGRAQGGGTGARRDPLGDDPLRRASLLEARNNRRRHARAGAGDRRDDRGRARDRQFATPRAFDLPAGIHAGGGDRERVRRGSRDACAPFGAVCGRSRAVRTDAARQYRRATLRRPPRTRPRRAGAGDVFAPEAAVAAE